MTVRELIDALSRLPQDAKVLVYSRARYDDTSAEITDIKVYGTTVEIRAVEK